MSLLLENGEPLLFENGEEIAAESETTPGVLLEGGDLILLEGGELLLFEYGPIFDAIFRIPSPVYKLDNLRREARMLEKVSVVKESVGIIVEGWEASVQVSGLFHGKVEIYNSPNGSDWVKRKTATGPDLFGRNDIGFPTYAMKANIPELYQIYNGTIPSVASGIAGVTIDQVKTNNGAGTARLVFTFADSTLQWRAPNSTVLGAAVDVSTGGSFTLADGMVTAKTIDVTVVAGSLPGEDTTINPTISNSVVSAIMYAERRHR